MADNTIARDDIIRMAKECGDWSGQTVEMNDVGLERFFAIATAAEREACAQVCDDWPNGRDDVCLLADAIRARGEK